MRKWVVALSSVYLEHICPSFLKYRIKKIDFKNNNRYYEKICQNLDEKNSFLKLTPKER